MKILALKRKILSCTQWLIAAILAAQEAETGRIEV
jgi:hypothetical protein